MNSPIFLSASIPQRDLELYIPDPPTIRQAILALIAVAAPKRLLVFGGHPAISPLVEQAAQNLNVVNNIHIFQSNLFRQMVPPEAKRFPNLHWTKVVRRRTSEDTRRASLTGMRTKMIESQNFGAAVFIGGMDGVEEEWNIFGQLHPNAPRIPVASTQGAAMLLWSRNNNPNADLKDDLRYRTIFRKYLP